MSLLAVAVTTGMYLSQVKQNSTDIEELKSQLARKDVEDERWQQVQQALAEIKSQIAELQRLQMEHPLAANISKPRIQPHEPLDDPPPSTVPNK